MSLDRRGGTGANRFSNRWKLERSRDEVRKEQHQAKAQDDADDDDPGGDRAGAGRNETLGQAGGGKRLRDKEGTKSMTVVKTACIGGSREGGARSRATVDLEGVDLKSTLPPPPPLPRSQLPNLFVPSSQEPHLALHTSAKPHEGRLKSTLLPPISLQVSPSPDRLQTPFIGLSSVPERASSTRVTACMACRKSKRSVRSLTCVYDGQAPIFPRPNSDDPGAAATADVRKQLGAARQGLVQLRLAVEALAGELGSSPEQLNSLWHWAEAQRVLAVASRGSVAQDDTLGVWIPGKRCPTRYTPYTLTERVGVSGKKQSAVLEPTSPPSTASVELPQFTPADSKPQHVKLPGFQELFGIGANQAGSKR